MLFVDDLVVVLFYDDVGDMLVLLMVEWFVWCFGVYFDVLCDVLVVLVFDLLLLFDVFNWFWILCVICSGLCGVEYVNVLVVVYVRYVVCVLFVVGVYWFIGWLIMVMCNDYVFGLFNGDIGIVLFDVYGVLCVWFWCVDGIVCVVLLVVLLLYEMVFVLMVYKL